MGWRRSDKEGDHPTDEQPLSSDGFTQQSRSPTPNNGAMTLLLFCCFRSRQVVTIPRWGTRDASQGGSMAKAATQRSTPRARKYTKAEQAKAMRKMFQELARMRRGV